jgi:predicted permease
MPRIPGIRRAFRLPWGSASRVQREVDDELRFHLEMKTKELTEAGVPPTEADRRARAQFGDIEFTRQYMNHTDRGRMLDERRAEFGDELRQDIRFSLRQLRRNPGFTAIALITLALGIGANTAIFSVVRGVLLRQLPYAAPESLVRVFSTYEGELSSVSPADFNDWARQSKLLAGLSASNESTVNLTGTGTAERFRQARVSANAFQLLGVKPALGRAFLPGEDKADAQRVVILSDGLWRTRFGADPRIIGKTITLDGYATEIVGVAPPEMRYPRPVDMWLTTRFTDRELSDRNRGARWIDVFGRLAPGVSIQQASSELATIAKQLEQRDPNHNTGYSTHLIPLQNQLTGSVRVPLMILLIAVGFVLLIACANVASLMLGRTAARETEMAVRTALGAGRGRLVRQLLTESTCLALLGGVLGLGLALVATRVLVAMAPRDLPRMFDVHVDTTVLAYTLGTTAVAALLFGSIPALQASVGKLASTLREGGRGSGGRPGSAHARSALVVAEMTLALMLLTGAGLMLRSFERLRKVNPGFVPEHVSTFSVSLSPVKYETLEQQRVFAATLLEQVHRIPGVDTAGLSFNLPLMGGGFVISFTVQGRPAPAPNDEPAAQLRVVSPGYFKAMGIPLRRGRGIESIDRDGAPRAFVISEETARLYFKGEDPIGKHLEFGWGRDGTRLSGEIVGIVGDVRQGTLRSDVSPHAYAAFDQWPIDELTVVMRTKGDPAAVLRSARSVVAALDKDLPVYDAFTLESMVSRSLGQPRFYLTLLSVFAVLAVVLAAVGIYGVIAYTVQQRTRELGIRMALGASAENVVAMVVGRGFVLALAGVALGSVGAFAVTRVMRSLLFGVSERDPATFIAVAVLLGVVALVASWIPARRAAKVDPLAAMRTEG